MTESVPEQPAEMMNISDVDRVIHEPARLIIMAHLYMVESADFLFLMQQTGLTFGNLSSHMKKMEEAEYIEVLKEFVDRRPHTMLKLTEQGRQAFKEYRQKMKHIFEED